MNRLREIREARGLPRYVLARKARVSTSTLNLIEIYDLLPNRKVLERIARVLEVPVEAILGEEVDTNAVS